MIKEKDAYRDGARKKFQMDCQQICFDIIAKERVKAKNERIADNTSRLLEYVDTIRATYDGELLRFIEDTVIKKWASIKFRRAANLAHFDVEKAIKCFEFKKMISEFFSSCDVESFDDDRKVDFKAFQDYICRTLFTKWESSGFKLSLDDGRTEVEDLYISMVLEKEAVAES